jgi:two-component system response regulator AgrA
VNIFILEDDLLQQQLFERLIKDILLERKWFARQIVTTAKPEHLLNALEESMGENIYFLDIEIKENEKRGLQVAQDIRKLDAQGLIVFVTTHSEFAPITYSYQVSALEFIEKNLEKEIFKKKVEDCLEILFKPKDTLINEDAFIFKNQQTSFQVPFADILFFETSDISHKVRLVGKNRRLEFYATLEEIAKLDDRLYQCHRSFVINLANVESIEHTDKIVTFFDNKRTCFITRRKIKYALQKIEQLKNISPKKQ